MRIETTIVAALMALTASPQDNNWMAKVLRDIENNNTQLKAVLRGNEATMAEAKAENVVGETAVEYTPFFQKGADGMASSELVVSQEFDFPTLYGARRKSARMQQTVLDRQYDAVRKEILQNAQNLCYDLLKTVDMKALLDKRMAAADTLLRICERRMQMGTATIMEQNRIRLDRMDVKAEAVQNDGERMRIISELQRLGAGSIADMEITAIPEGWDPGIRSTAMDLATASVAAAGQEVRVQQQELLPKMSVGYRRNTELHDYALNGVLVSVAMPLFSNSKKVKAARLRKTASEAELENVRHDIASRRVALQHEADHLRTLLATYDTELMDRTLATLLRAVAAGEITVAEYYTEADRVYTSMQRMIETKNSHHKVMAELITLINLQSD